MTLEAGNTPRPDGLDIQLTEYPAPLLANVRTEMQRRDPFRVHEGILFIAKMDGTRTGELLADFYTKQEPSSPDTVADKYVYLRIIAVLGTERRHGIGSALLTELDSHAIQFGASRIEGVINPYHLQRTPSLPEFYTHRGFHLTPRLNPAGDSFTMVKPL